jgi:hypothetical protein
MLKETLRIPGTNGIERLTYCLYQNSSATSLRLASPRPPLLRKNLPYATSQHTTPGWASVLYEGPVLARTGGRDDRYSPECVEGEFCELRPNGVLRSWHVEPLSEGLGPSAAYFRSYLPAGALAYLRWTDTLT